MSTGMSGFQSFFRFFALFCTGLISHHQHKGAYGFPSNHSKGVWQCCLFAVDKILEIWPMWRTDRTSAHFIYGFHFLFNKFVFEFNITILHLYEDQNKTLWVKKLNVRDRVDMLILDSVYVRRRHVTATQDNCGLLLHRRSDNPVTPRATMMQTPPTDTGITILQINLFLSTVVYLLPNKR